MAAETFKPPREPWGPAVLGTLPALVGPVLILLASFISLLLKPVLEADQPAVQQTLMTATSWFLLLLEGALIAALIFAWVRGWPRWSYPYLGLQLTVSLWIGFSALPGFNFFGRVLGGEIIGWRAWIPEMIILAVGLALTRSLRPLKQLFGGIGRDWSLLSFAFYGLLPVALLISFDEVRGDEPILALGFLILAGGALAYMRTRGPMPGFLWLAGAVLLAWAVSAVFLGYYWNGRQETWMDAPGNGWNSFFSCLEFGLFLTVLLSLPGLAAAFARRVKRPNP